MAFSRVHLIVSGRVQGVNFRWSALTEARRLGLSGWVRNLPGGEVEAVAEGPKDQLEELVRWCRQGPRLARVSAVKTEWTQATGEWSDFRVTY